MKIIALLTLLLAVCSNAAFNPSNYPNTKQLSDGYTIFWSVDDTLLRLALKANTTGWLGFGLGEITSGSMPGADIVTAEWNSTDNTQLIIHDRFAESFSQPSLDTCEDWVLYDYHSENNYLIVEVYRRVNTLDPQDRPIENTETKIIWAYGTSKQISYHGPETRGMSMINFYSPSNSGPVVPINETYESFEILMPAVEIPPVETTYMCFSKPVPKTDKNYHVIRVDPKIQENTSLYVHHFLVHICEHKNTSDNAAEKYKVAQPCYSPLGNIDQGCTGILYVWAPGGGPFELPLEAGFLMGESDTAIKYLILEIHYDNILGHPGKLDSSGVSITFTPNLRQYNAGVLMVGDPLVTEYSIPALTPAFKVTGNCPQECTSKWPHDITVFSDGLHMHQTGKMMWSTVYRGGSDPSNKMAGYFARVEYWNFDLQYYPKVNRVIKRGDSIHTHCVYDTSKINRTVNFGAASSDEMCIEFISYYPRLLQVHEDTGEENLYTFCGKLRGIYTINGTTLPNPDKKFATVCGDLQFPETFIWDQDGLTVNNPTFEDEGGDSRNFGRIPQSCSALPVLPQPTPNSQWKDSVMLALGIIAGVLLLAFIGALVYRGSNRFDEYEPLSSDDELGHKKK